jgi:CRP-like cAMP-binding protein
MKSTFTSFLEHNNSRILSHNNSRENINIQEEKTYYKPGQIFGDWDLINKSNKLMATATEETDLLSLEKQKFMDCLYKIMIRADNDRQDFLKLCIRPLKNIAKFDSYFKTFVPIFHERNQEIYAQGKIESFIYLIFMGECELYRESPESKRIPLLKLERGSFAGLEILFPPNKGYSSTLKVINNIYSKIVN